MWVPLPQGVRGVPCPGPCLQQLHTDLCLRRVASLSVSECKGIILQGAFFPPFHSHWEMAPSPGLPLIRLPARENRAQPLIRQLQGGLGPTLGQPGADNVGLGPATPQLLSQTCLQGPPLEIEAVRSRELLCFVRHQSRLPVATGNSTLWGTTGDKDLARRVDGDNNSREAFGIQTWRWELCLPHVSGLGVWFEPAQNFL